MRFIFLLTLLLLQSCSTVSRQTDDLLVSPNVPKKSFLTNVPYIRQKENYCGPASLAMVLNRAGKELSEDELKLSIFTPAKNGTYQTDLITAARRMGLMAIKIRGIAPLVNEIADGNPVIVFQNLGFSYLPNWHYAVAIGYDLDGPDIILHSGDKKNTKSDLRFFERSWALADYWGLVVLPAGELSSSAGEVEHLEAAAGLERIGKYKAAKKAYKSILTRWPKSLVGLIGLGNVLYIEKKFHSAVKYLEIANENHPDSDIVKHNLAVAKKAVKK